MAAAHLGPPGCWLALAATYLLHHLRLVHCTASCIYPSLTVSSLSTTASTATAASSTTALPAHTHAPSHTLDAAVVARPTPIALLPTCQLPSRRPSPARPSPLHSSGGRPRLIAAAQRGPPSPIQPAASPPPASPPLRATSAPSD
ncbi:hypothetical protein BS50DRAFT_576656 [Corynespora cassiicola Philippines]|uniref:Uncharacterized protein n=1 Tax=Corynespora cassiicola Philippines TaxID=1448308 RepID=A0A2T2NF21_CORCC|nr:hypothetical protein BS50DRAFT_576656 [Corynespora cassiicola Philippines]